MSSNKKILDPHLPYITLPGDLHMRCPKCGAGLTGRRQRMRHMEEEKKKQNLEEYKAMIDKLKAMFSSMSDTGLRNLEAMIQIEIAERARKRLEDYNA